MWVTGEIGSALSTIYNLGNVYSLFNQSPSSYTPLLIYW